MTKQIDKGYFNLRQLLGVVGIALPALVVTIGLLGQNGPEWYFSISATYYTNSRDLFVGAMVAVGAFLITYSIDGYSRQDDIINRVTGLFAFLIIAFPCGATELERVGIFLTPVKVSSILHNISASVFFLLRTYNVLFLFTKSDGQPTKEKLQRNIVYRICGAGIVGFMINQVITSFLALVGPYTLINEAGMLFFDGISWLVKGGSILRDKTASPVVHL